MSIIIALITGVICLGLGFVAGKLYTEKSLDKAEMQAQIDESKQQMEQYKEDVAANLAVTQKLMADLKANYDTLAKQMNATTRLLESPRSGENVAYFGPNTKELAATSHVRDDRRRKPEAIEAQPTDYSDGTSGLFNNSETDTKKPQTDAV